MSDGTPPRLSDLILHPVVSTFKSLPWHQRKMRCVFSNNSITRVHGNTAIKRASRTRRALSRLNRPCLCSSFYCPALASLFGSP